MELTIIIIIISSTSLAFLIFNLWYLYENFDYICEYNNKYKNLVYVKGPNLIYEKFNFNDSLQISENKFRCKEIDGKFYSFSKRGFRSNDSSFLNLSWDNLKDCIYRTFNDDVFIIYDACMLNSESKDCKLLNKLLENGHL